jgi:hypothetical protein
MEIGGVFGTDPGPMCCAQAVRDPYVNGRSVSKSVKTLSSWISRVESKPGTFLSHTTVIGVRDGQVLMSINKCMKASRKVLRIQVEREDQILRPVQIRMPVQCLGCPRTTKKTDSRSVSDYKGPSFPLVALQALPSYFKPLPFFFSKSFFWGKKKFPAGELNNAD